MLTCRLAWSSICIAYFVTADQIFFDENSQSVSDINTLKHLMMHEKYLVLKFFLFTLLTEIDSYCCCCRRQ